MEALQTVPLRNAIDQSLHINFGQNRKTRCPTQHLKARPNPRPDRQGRTVRGLVAG